jgi:hypothetical protein
MRRGAWRHRTNASNASNVEPESTFVITATILTFMAVSITATAGTLLAVRGDRIELIRSGTNGKDRYIVNGDVISELHRLAKHTIMVAAGFYVAYVLRSYPLTEPGRRALEAVLYVFACLSWLITENSLIDLYRRHFSPHGPRLRGKHL